MARLVVRFWVLFLITVRLLSGDKELPRRFGSFDSVLWNFLRYSVAFDSSSTRVTLIYWKNSSLAYLAALLLLCGDVSQNPGPPEIFSCGVCALEVSNSDAAVCCDYCDHWIHVSCDPLLSIDNYNDMVSNPSTEPWFCFYCKESLSKHVGESSTTISALRGISCVCLNARSVVSKRFDLSVYVSIANYDIVAITETFLDDSIHDSHIAPPGYTVFRKDRNRHGGGVLLLIRDSLNASLRPDLDGQCEVLWVSIPTKFSSILLGVFYRCPLAPPSVLEALRSTVCSAVTHNQPVILCGDFNLPHIDWSITSPLIRSPAATMLCDIVSDCFLAQLVSANTRQDSILDLVLTNIPDRISQVTVCDNIPGTDHDAVKFVIDVELCSKANSPPRYLFDYSKIDQDHFVSIFSRIPWNLIDYGGDIELSWAM